jgi:hypothetical protein
VLRLRSTLREFFPAALEAFTDLAAADTLILLERAPSPALAAKLTRGQLIAALRAARRHHVETKAVALQEICGRRRYGSRRSWTAHTPRSSAARYGSSPH